MPPDNQFHVAINRRVHPLDILRRLDGDAGIILFGRFHTSRREEHFRAPETLVREVIASLRRDARMMEAVAASAPEIAPKLAVFDNLRLVADTLVSHPAEAEAFSRHIVELGAYLDLRHTEKGGRR